MSEPPIVARTRRFYDWEIRGRGWIEYPYPVLLEPPFRPFVREAVLPVEQIDDGRRETPLSRLLGAWNGTGPAKPPPKEDDEPQPEPTNSTLTDEAQLLLPESLHVSLEATHAWLDACARCRHPLSFELLGHEGAVSIRLATHPHDTQLALGSLRSFFPDVYCVGEAEILPVLWENCATRAAIIEFGLAREFMLPLSRPKSFTLDPLTGLIGALAATGLGECAVVQVLFGGTRAPWRENLLRAVTTPAGDPFFLDAPEITALAREKAASRLFGVALRLGVAAGEESRLWSLLRSLSAALTHLGSPEGNELVPLGTERSYEELEGDLLTRATHRSGMLLSTLELSGLVHLPSETVTLPELVRERMTSKLPPEALTTSGVFLGHNLHRGKRTRIKLPESARLKHVHVVGASGTGKSTLLAWMILQDIERGAGVGLIDPHGDLVDAVLDRLPDSRLDDVVLLDPAATGFSVGWNILEAHDEVEREMLTADLAALFKRLATTWGDQMTAVLTHALGALLSRPEPSTLLDLRRFLADEKFRADVLVTVPDSYVTTFWRREFQLLKGHPQAPILTRLDTFLRSRLVRDAVTRTTAPLDVQKLIDSGGILLVKLAQGVIGQEHAALLGALLVSTIHQKALARQSSAEESRRPFFLYLDEFHEVVTPSMASLFSGARKFRLALTVAHQDLYQLHAHAPEVERAVLANAHTRIVFRAGEDDARKLSGGFSGFTAEHVAALSVGEAVMRVGGRAHDCNLTTLRLEDVDEEVARERRVAVQARMRERFPRRDGSPPPEMPPQSPPPHKPPPEPPKARRHKPQEEKLPGRGGPEHTYLQELVARFAQERGFKATREAPAGVGQVDVALEREDIRLAVEVAISTPPEHELENVKKGLAAGFTEVLVISRRPAFRRALSKLVRKLPDRDQEKVSVLSPEEAFSHLASLGATEAVRGYRVRRRYQMEGESGEEAKYQAITRVIGESLKRLRGER